MKKKFLLLMGLFAIGLVQAQVGINTSDPQGVFHLDGQNNTNATVNTIDDVVVTATGNVGIGAVAPQKRLEIISTTPGAIRIADTSQADRKVLTSSSTGAASWDNVIGSWNASLTGGNLPYTSTIGRRKINFTGGTISDPTEGAVNPVAGSMKIPFTGTYRLTILGTSLINNASGYFIAGFYTVERNGSEVWAPHSLGSTTISLSPYVSYYSIQYLNKNDVLILWSNEQTRNYANAVANMTFFVEFIK